MPHLIQEVMTKLTSAFTHTCITAAIISPKLLSQVLQWGKHASLPFTGLFRLDPCRFIGIQTAATVAVLTGSGQSLSEPTLWFTTTNDNLPITINLFRKNRGQNSMQIIESTCCHFFYHCNYLGMSRNILLSATHRAPAPRERVENSTSAVPVNISYNDRGRIK